MRFVFALFAGLLASLSGFAQSPTTPPTITTYAGPRLPVSGAPAVTQAIDGITSVASDGAGGFYVANKNQNRVYRVTADGVLNLVAGRGPVGFSGDGGPATAAQLNSPMGVAADAAGSLYIADSGNARIRKVTAGGVITTIAGTGIAGYSGDGGPAVSAQLNSPEGLALDTGGNLYIAESGNVRIRKVSVDGVIHTVVAASPGAVAVDATGSIYFAAGSTVRRVTAGGVISTIAGTGTAGFSGDGGPATLAQLNSVTSLALDAAGNVYIADPYNYRIRKVTTDGIISTVGGNGIAGFSGDGGPATSAQLSLPLGIAVDTASNIYIADVNSFRIRKVTSDGVISTVAGFSTAGYSGDGGSPTSARFSSPRAVAMDAAGNLYIADAGNARIRKVTPNGVVSTVAGNGTPGFSGDGGPATSAQLQFPWGVAVDSAGNLYIADSANNRIRKVTPGGTISTIAGTGPNGFSGDGGPAILARFRTPRGLALDGRGNLYIADYYNNRIRKLTPDGMIATVVGNGTADDSGDGSLAVAAGLVQPSDVAFDSSGNLYIADSGNAKIRKVSPVGIITTFATIPPGFGSSDAVAVDPGGNVYITDSFNLRIRKITPAGIITTIAGNGTSGFSGDDGAAGSSQVADAVDLVTDVTGNLYIADAGNNRIRKVIFSQPVYSYTFSDRGGASSVTSGTSPEVAVGYARIQPNTGSMTPAGLAIFGFRQNGVLVTEAAVPASSLMTTGRIYAEVNGPVNTGLAIANPNGQTATVSFYFTDDTGTNSGGGTTTIPANGKTSVFLNQAPFNGGSSFSGTFTFSSSVPISAAAFRGFVNERSEFLITTLPLIDLSTPPASGSITFPEFADGGGWTTRMVLVNPGDTILTGRVQFLNQAGVAAAVTVNGQTSNSFEYLIPPRTSKVLQTSGLGGAVVVGSVRVVSENNVAVPSGLAIFSFKSGGTTVTEAGVPVIPTGNAFRLYAEARGSLAAVGSIQTGLAIVNSSPGSATVTLELSRLDGSSTEMTGTLNIPANGQVTKFLHEIPGLTSIQIPFQGILRVSSTASISLTGVRGRYNERGEFLLTTTPPINEAASSSSGPLYFPHVVDSGGYTTQFILYSGQPGGALSGTTQLFSSSGVQLNWTLY